MSDQETGTFTVLRTSDAKKQEITVLMSNTLQQLKEILGQKKHFGPLSSTNQRIFHMGRELKSGGRSLANLGLGRFNNHILHLHVVTSKSVKHGNSVGSLPKTSSTSVSTTHGRRRNRTSSVTTTSATTTTATTTMAATTTSTSNVTSSSGRNRSNPRTTDNTRFKNDTVIDLLSDSDDDEEQEVICVDDTPIEASGTKRRRMR